MKTYQNGEKWYITRYIIRSITSESTGVPNWYIVSYVKRLPKSDVSTLLDDDDALNMAVFFQDNREREKTLFCGDGDAGKRFAQQFHKLLTERFNVAKTHDDTLDEDIFHVSARDGGKPYALQTLVEVSINVEPFYIRDVTSKSGYIMDGGSPKTYTAVSALFAAKQLEDGSYMVVEQSGDAEAILAARYERAINRGQYVRASSVNVSTEAADGSVGVNDFPF